MSSFGEEYVELVIFFDADTKYTFDLSIDVIDFCEKQYIRSLKDFDWYDMQKFIKINFDIDFDDGNDENVLFKHEITRNIWAEFDIKVHCFYGLTYNKDKFDGFMRKLKIKKFLDDNED